MPSTTKRAFHPDLKARKTVSAAMQQTQGATSHYVRGNAYFAKGEFAKAKVSYLQAIAFDDHHVDAYFNLGNTCYLSQQFNEAVNAYSKALCLAQPQSDIYNSLGVTYLALGNLVAAKTSFLQAIGLNAEDETAFFNLGNVLTKEREYPLAAKCFERAVALKPTHGEAHQNYGSSQLRVGNLDAAEQSYLEALRLLPSDRALVGNLAQVWSLQGKPEGLSLYSELVAFDPADANMRWNASTAFLLHGNYDRGWREYESRWMASDFKPQRREFTSAPWQGEALTGKRILIFAEQGLGDTLQFARYVPMLASLEATVVLEVQPSLKGLLQFYPGVTQCIANGELIPDVDYHCALMSLPFRFKTRLEDIPPCQPLQPASGSAGSNRNQGKAAGAKVGLVWAGNPEHQYDNLRSLDLSQLRPLSAVEGASFVSLQKGSAQVEAAEWELEHVIPASYDFAATAAVIADLDLVISVDTAVAHLAASMSKPVWLLLRSIPEWRWGLSGETSPWYPTMTLFRSTNTGWSGPIAEVAFRLGLFVAGKQRLAVLTPEEL